VLAVLQAFQLKPAGAASASCGCFGDSGAPDSDWTGLANPPEDWPAADLPAAQRLLRSVSVAAVTAAVTPRESQSRDVLVWLVYITAAKAVFTIIQSVFLFISPVRRCFPGVRECEGQIKTCNFLVFRHRVLSNVLSSLPVDTFP